MYEVHDYRPISVFYTSVDKDSPEYINFSQIDFNAETEFDSYIEDIEIESKYITPFCNSVHSTYIFSSDEPVKYSHSTRFHDIVHFQHTILKKSATTSGALRVMILSFKSAQP